MRVPSSWRVVGFAFLLLVLTLLLQPNETTPSSAATRREREIEALLDQLVSLQPDEEDDSGEVKATSFAFLDPPGKSHMLLPHPKLSPSELRRAIVKQGVAAVPHLLAHLDDKRPIGLTVHGTLMGILFCTTPDYNPFTEPPPGVEDRDVNKLLDLRFDAEEEPPSNHQATVGDWCFTTLGQIVNRRYEAVSYLPQLVVVTSPTHSPRIAQIVRRQWVSLTPSRHRAALLADWRHPDFLERCIGACRCLAEYYPDALEETVLPWLSEEVEPQLAESLAKLIEGGLLLDDNVRIDQAVHRLMVTTTNDQLALACMKRLIGRGYDADIEERCRRHGALDSHTRESFEKIRGKLGWTRVHGAVERQDVDALRELVRRGVDVNGIARNGQTALHLAAANGDPEFVRVLLTARPQLDIQDREGFTPVQLAARADHDAVVRLLVQHGCAVPDLLVAAAAGTCAEARAILVRAPQSIKTRNAYQRTPLLLAARRGDRAMTALLLEHGADSATADEKGGTPLHLAVYHGDEAMTRLLLEHHASLDVALAESEFRPLELAITFGRRRIVQLLLEAGAPIRAREEGGQTPLHLAINCPDPQIVRLLLDHGADLKKYNRDGRTPLHEAAATGQTDLVRLFLQHHASIRERDKAGDDVLHLAVVGGHLETVRLLLAEGAPLDSDDSSSDTPLHTAASQGSLEMVRLLLDHRANVKAKNHRGEEPLHLAIAAGHTSIVRLLLDHRADANLLVKNPRQYPLHLAIQAEKPQPEIVRLLLQHGADVNVTDTDWQTPLHYAAKINSLDIARLLLEHRADVRAVERTEDLEPLHIAATHKNGAALAALLLAYKADINARKLIDGKTPLHVAVSAQNVAMIRFLLERGADVTLKDAAGLTPLELAQADEDNPALLTPFRERGLLPK